MPRTLVTSALPYVNNIPHLGNLIGATLSADVYARHARLKGEDVLYVCGADEHGTATETKAKEEGVSPQELCDKYIKVHKRIYDWFNISFDVWGRTHTPTHTKITQDIFLALHENGYINERDVEQLYDEEAKTFLADRFVEGTCPHCKAQGARGDQCDSCQQLINAPELIDPVSKITGTKPVIKRTKHLFLDLTALKQEVEEFKEQRQGLWSRNALSITDNWLADLKERAITRDLKWGVPVPLKGYEDKVFYVWFDAPIGYISITAHARNDWEDWWRDTDTRLVQFMGKDNTVFHTVIFPATLIGTRQAWNLVDRASVTEFLNMEDTKFSKSKGTGVFGDDAIAIEKEHGIPADAWRYYLLSNRPETSDSTFGWNDFQARINNELIANLGNLVHRALTFIDDRISVHGDFGKQQEEFLKESKAIADKIVSLHDEARIREAVSETMRLAKHANQYFQHREPWKTIKTDEKTAAADLRAIASVVKDLSILTSPITPTIADRIQAYLGLEGLIYEDLGEPLKALDIHKPEVLLSKIEDETITQLKKTYSEKTTPLDLRAARILEAKEHPNADRLLILDIDLGSEHRQLVAGLAQHYKTDELKGKSIIVVANLEPAVLRGERSEGMLLAAEEDGKVGLLLVDAEPGTPIRPKDKTASEDQITFKQFQEHKIAAAEKVTLDGEELQADITVDKGINGPVR